MSQNVGYLLRRKVEGRDDVFGGELHLPQISGPVYLIPHDTRRQENSPHYALKVRCSDGDYRPFGNAWVKAMKAGGKMFSITVDGPTMPAPIYVAAFPDDEQPKEAAKGEPHCYTIRWGRPKRPAHIPAATSDVLADAIPY